MLFSEQKSQEFCGPYFASGRRTWLRAASTDTGTAQQHRDVRGDLGHTTFETVRGSLTRRAADEGRLLVHAVAATHLRTRARSRAPNGPRVHCPLTPLVEIETLLQLNLWNLGLVWFFYRDFSRMPFQ